MNVLLIRFSALGDIVLTYPVLKFLSEKVNKVDFITNPMSLDILSIDEIEYIIFKKEWSFWKKLSFIFRMRKKKYDLIIDLQNNRWSRRIISFSRADNIVVNEDREDRHAIFNYSDTIKKFFPEFKLQDSYKIPYKTLVEEKLPNIKKPYACIFFSSSKRWISKRPNLYSIEKIIDLLDKRGLSIVQIGDNNDRVVCDERVFDVTGKLSIRQLKKVLSLSKFLITTDSFPMHLAAFCECPVIALFGPTDPSRCGPYGKNNIILYKGINCQPCYNSKCENNICMNIDIGKIEDAIEKIYHD